MTNASAAGPATSIAANVNNALAIGRVIIGVCAWVPSATSDTCTFSDASGTGNTWVTDAIKVHTALSIALAIGRCEITTTLPGTLHTQTATISASVTDLAVAWYAINAGFLYPISLDGSNTNQGTATASATPGSVTPTVQPDFLVAAYAEHGAFTGTPPAGYTELNDTGGTSVIQLNMITNLSADLGARNPAETLSGSTNWVAAQVLYKATRKSRGSENPGGQLVPMMVAGSRF